MNQGETPQFRYHPDPLATGSAVARDGQCSVCAEPRRVFYDGPIYGDEPDLLCLVCISSGRAATALAVDDEPAVFTDTDSGVPADVPPEVLEEVAQRTPGFTGWQQEHWLYHCGDAAAYLGRVGFEELSAVAEALEMVLHENDEYGWTPEASLEYAQALHADGDATAYLFRCLSCARHLAYTDMS